MKERRTIKRKGREVAEREIAADLIKTTAESVARALDVKGTKEDIAHLRETFATHAQADSVSFAQINTILSGCATKKDIQELSESMAPMLKIFNDNNIVRTRLSGDFKTIVLYSAGITTIGGLFYGVVYLLKHFLK